MSLDIVDNSEIVYIGSIKMTVCVFLDTLLIGILNYVL